MHVAFSQAHVTSIATRSVRLYCDFPVKIRRKGAAIERGLMQQGPNSTRKTFFKAPSFHEISELSRHQTDPVPSPLCLPRVEKLLISENEIFKNSSFTQEIDQ